MARTDTLTNFLTDIADSIRLKTGETGKIALSDFDSKISGIKTKEKAFNVFVQMDEPESKEGIWAKTEREIEEDFSITNQPFVGSLEIEAWARHSFDKISTGTRPTLIGKWLYWPQVSGTDYRGWKMNIETGENAYLCSTPSEKDLTYNTCAAVGNYIYYWGSSAYRQGCIRYNLDTNNYTNMAAPPVPINRGCAVAVGTDIYIAAGRAVTGGSSYASSGIILKYDTLTNTYEQFLVPTYLADCDISVIGEWMYFIGTFDQDLSTKGSYASHAYKWNINTKEWIQLAEMPILEVFSHCVIDGKILIGTKGYNKNNEKGVFLYYPSEDRFESMDHL